MKNDKKEPVNFDYTLLRARVEAMRLEAEYKALGIDGCLDAVQDVVTKNEDPKPLELLATLKWVSKQDMSIGQRNHLLYLKEKVKGFM